VSESRGSLATPKGRSPKASRPGLFSRIALYFRQVAAEMRKVVWPTRSQLLTYTGVVIVFVFGFALFVLGADLAIAKGVTFVFGN